MNNRFAAHYPGLTCQWNAAVTLEWSNLVGFTSLSGASYGLSPPYLVTVNYRCIAVLIMAKPVSVVKPVLTIPSLGGPIP
jgi:hypothetical protein